MKLALNIENQFSGLGSEDAIEGLKSVGIYWDGGDGIYQSPLYIIVDQNFNISSHVGIPVNGIIGSSVFNNNLFEINYEKRKGFSKKNIEVYQMWNYIIFNSALFQFLKLIDETWWFFQDSF
jgi:hypothetical protein